MPAVLAVTVLSAAHLWVGRIYTVASGSMAPTLAPDERVLVDLRARDDIRRGDVVLVDVSNTWTVLGGGRATVVKRVIGLPGERITCCDRKGRLSVDGVALAEPYLAAGGPGPAYDVVVPSGRVWLLGDDRERSRDARDHLGSPGGGTVSMDDVIGRAVAVVWPPARALARPAG